VKLLGCSKTNFSKGKTMIKNLLAAMVLFLVPCFAQSTAPAPSVRPYVFGGIGLMPGGYASTAGFVGTGLDVERPKFLANVFAGYDNGHKSNDGTVNNSKGHDRYLYGTVGYRFTTNTYGLVGARWSQLSTSNYSKGGSAFNSSSWMPQFGAGHDWLRPRFSLRGEALYFLPSPNETVNYPDGTHCNKCGNGTQGADFNVWIPSPVRKGHFFFHEQVLVYGFHATITEPTNASLTAAQLANRGVTASTKMTLLYRF
jgi:hypothetical protein